MRVDAKACKTTLTHIRICIPGNAVQRERGLNVTVSANTAVNFSRITCAAGITEYYESVCRRRGGEENTGYAVATPFLSADNHGRDLPPSPRPPKPERIVIILEFNRTCRAPIVGS